jgi:hypothetical protein
MSLSLLDHCLTSWWSPCAAICKFIQCYLLAFYKWWQIVFQNLQSLSNGNSRFQSL